MEITKEKFSTFFLKAKPAGIEGNIFLLECPDDFALTNLQKRYGSFIENGLSELAGRELVLKVGINRSLKAANEAETKAAALAAGPQKPTLGPLFTAEEDQSKIVKDKQDKAHLSPRFTFDNYIMGKNNNLAYAVATSVAERPGEMYNPVFLYSGVGLGKTHLLQAIGNKIIQTKPSLKVIYSTGEAFTNELVEAIQSGKGGRGRYTTNEFRNKFRKADVFLIDDVQFVIGREATQEEFFHTFNDLFMAQKQIVITSDRPPKEFNTLADRITSRFSSGIIVDIQPPDFETRSAILRRRRDQLNDTIPNDILDFIAQNITTNIRELEGAYNQVVTYAKTEKLELTLEVAARALGQSLKEKKTINAAQILKAVCTYYSIKTSDIKGESRKREYVIPRQVAMYLIKEMSGMPLESIGDLLGGRDHTTIMHGAEKIAGEVIEVSKTRQDVQNLKQMLG